MYNRLIKLEKDPEDSFFVWGPRQSGKSTWLKKFYPDAIWIDLLNSEQFIKYKSEPHRLREELELQQGRLVVIDEIQKVPQLLDEIHWLIVNKDIKFGMCGSSARKLRRGHANLLGGRAIRYEMFGFCKAELKDDFDLLKILNFGYLPKHYLAKNPRKRIASYITDYLKEEVAAEGLVRNLPAFVEFLRSAALGDTQPLSVSTIARDCGVSADTISNYYQILEDTLLGRKLPAYSRNQKRRVVKTPKFYLFDVGIVNSLAKRGYIEKGSAAFGHAFENWVFHEITAYKSYNDKDFELSYWGVPGTTEVDFILGEMEIAIEVKGTEKVRSDDLKGLRILKEEQPHLRMRILVSCEKIPRKTEDGILILPYSDFFQMLWASEIL